MKLRECMALKVHVINVVFDMLMNEPGELMSAEMSGLDLEKITEDGDQIYNIRGSFYSHLTFL
jgi:hypothetical protein